GENRAWRSCRAPSVTCLGSPPSHGTSQMAERYPSHPGATVCSVTATWLPSGESCGSVAMRRRNRSSGRGGRGMEASIGGELHRTGVGRLRAGSLPVSMASWTGRRFSDHEASVPPFDPLDGGVIVERLVNDPDDHVTT